MAAETVPTDPLSKESLPSNRTSVDDRLRDVEKPTESKDELSNSSDADADIEKDAQSPEHSQPEAPSTLVEFDGPNDPGNPKNWTAKRRWAITASMGSLVFTVTFASSIFSVNIGVVRDKFDVSIVTATLGVALFVLVCCTTLNLNTRITANRKCNRALYSVPLCSAPCRKCSVVAPHSSLDMLCSPSSKFPLPSPRTSLQYVLVDSWEDSLQQHRFQ